MPVTYRIDRDRGLIETTCAGEVTFEEVLDHFRALGADSAVPDRADVLLDLSRMTTLAEGDQLRTVASVIGESGVEWGTCAIVADRDALYGMLRMFEVFAEGRFGTTWVFRSRDAAEVWLERTRPEEA